ncbi:hypothetical protein bcere0022_27220 [Bacillus cereus Rock3-44]|nr:hypothetical protein bcere0022_27220 [Bacillus cereus Rock3-44]
MKRRRACPSPFFVGMNSLYSFACMFILLAIGNNLGEEKELGGR